jgi:RimJ/RimL family protein N-acetyltransferase
MAEAAAGRRGRVAPSIDGIETPRMYGRRPRPRPRDAEALRGLFGDPLVAKTLWPGSLGGPRTSGQVEHMLAEYVDHWDRYGYGPWLFFDRVTGEPVGRGGLRRTTIAGREETEVGWAVVSERWGQGLATEMGRAGVAAGFGAVGLRELVSFTLPGNAASRRVMEKVGFVYEGETEHAGLPHVLYRLRAPPWI